MALISIIVYLLIGTFALLILVLIVSFLLTRSENEDLALEDQNPAKGTYSNSIRNVPAVEYQAAVHRIDENHSSYKNDFSDYGGRKRIRVITRTFGNESVDGDEPHDDSDKGRPAHRRYEILNDSMRSRFR